MCLMIIFYSFQVNSDQTIWKKHLDLRIRDKRVIQNGKLGDRIMFAANKLLQAQFPHLQGLQSTLLSQTSFTPIDKSGGFIPEGKAL